MNKKIDKQEDNPIYKIKAIPNKNNNIQDNIKDIDKY